MNIDHHIQLESLRFCVFSSEDIKKLSVAKIVTSRTFGPLNNALPGGVYDPSLGQYCISADPCATCGQTLNCPGHFGHIELCALVYNPIFIKTVYDILRSTCLSCYRLQITEKIAKILQLQLKLIDQGYDIEAQDLDLYKTKDDDIFQSDDINNIDQSVDTRVDNENSFHAKLKEYEELLGLGNINFIDNLL